MNNSPRMDIFSNYKSIMNERKILLLQQKNTFWISEKGDPSCRKVPVFLCFIQMFMWNLTHPMWNSWFDISPNKWHQKWRHKKLRSIVKKAQMTTSLYQSVYFWQLGCRDFISYCFGLAKFKLNSLNLIFSRVFLHWVYSRYIIISKLISSNLFFDLV